MPGLGCKLYGIAAHATLMPNSGPHFTKVYQVMRKANQNCIPGTTGVVENQTVEDKAKYSR